MADNEANDKTPDPAPQPQEIKDDQKSAPDAAAKTEGAASLDPLHKLKPSAPSGTKSVLRITPKLGVSNTAPSVLTRPLSPLSGQTKPVPLTDSAKASALTAEAQKAAVPTQIPSRAVPEPAPAAAAKSAIPKPAHTLPSAPRSDAAKPAPTKPEAGTALRIDPVSQVPIAPNPAVAIPSPFSPDKATNPMYEQTKTPISKPAEAKLTSPSLGQDMAMTNKPELASSKLEQIKMPLLKPVQVNPAPVKPKSSDLKPSLPTPVPAPKAAQVVPASSASAPSITGGNPVSPKSMKTEQVNEVKTENHAMPAASREQEAMAAAEKVVKAAQNPAQGPDKPQPAKVATEQAKAATEPAKVVTVPAKAATEPAKAVTVPARVPAKVAAEGVAATADAAASVKKPGDTSAAAEKQLSVSRESSMSGLAADPPHQAAKELVSKMEDLEIKQEEVKMAADPADPAEVTKEGIRKRIWDYLEANNLVNFPRPVHNRIPNFKGANVAGDKMSTLDVFKKAQTVKINPDKPQEQCRFLTLEAHKTLLVPTPRLRQGLFNKINVPEDDQTKPMLKLCSTSQGIKEHSSPISLDSKVKIDLIIVGSVAVSKKGYRIGKGEGFADLEFGMMRAMEAVDDDIIVVTTVHESQVTEIPDHLLQDHDLTVDFIVTPTEIIPCERRDKPKGIIWSMLTREKLSRVPILKKLRERQREAGIDVTLKDGEEPEASESNQEDQDKPRQRDRRRRRRNTRNRDSEKEENEKGEGEGEKGEHSETGEDKDGKRRERRNNNRRRRRRSTRKSEGEGGEGGDGDTGPESGADGDKENAGDDRRRRPQRRRRRRSAKSQDGERSGDEEKGEGERKPPREGGPRKRQTSGPLSTVYVGALPRSLRVSEFKAQVRDRGINPLRVIWHGASGHAFLQFTKKDEADSALDSLKDMEIEGKPVKVEMSKRGVKSGNPEEHQANNNNEENGVVVEAAPVSDKEQ